MINLISMISNLDRKGGPVATTAVRFAVAIVLLLPACSSSQNRAEESREIDLTAFTTPARDAPNGGSLRDGDAAAALGEDGDGGATLGASSEDFDAEGFDDYFMEPLPPLRTLDPGESMIVESMVGQVNGQPIFADAFFDPIEDQLLAIRGRVDRREEFMRFASPVVMRQLREVVLNALFLAEAESTLTTEEQMGIRAWLKQVEGNVIAGYQGSEEKARKAIRDEMGITFEDHLEGLKDEFLVRRLLEEEVAPRVVVSWRDIEREYNQRIDEFRPIPRVTIARIRLSTARETVRIEEVQGRLENGEDFMAVAESLDLVGGTVWQAFEVTGDDLSQIDLANETIKLQMGTLKAKGDTTQPFELGTYTWWLHVMEYTEPEQRDLYDFWVQRRLAADIRHARRGEERDRYIESLLEDGIYDELDGMSQRLIQIAVHRYSP